jgi:DNA-binding transcriptional ArsR family regulator
MKDFEMPTDDQVALASDGFRLLADPTRIKILWALLQGESSVTCLADLVGTSPTAVSQHLSKLRLAKLVQARREGTFAFYSAADDHVARLLAEALYHADHQVQGLPDHPTSKVRSPRERRTQPAAVGGDGVE